MLRSRTNRFGLKHPSGGGHARVPGFDNPPGRAGERLYMRATLECQTFFLIDPRALSWTKAASRIWCQTRANQVLMPRRSIRDAPRQARLRPLPAALRRPGAGGAGAGCRLSPAHRGAAPWPHWDVRFQRAGDPISAWKPGLPVASASRRRGARPCGLYLIFSCGPIHPVDS